MKQRQRVLGLPVYSYAATSHAAWAVHKGIVQNVLVHIFSFPQNCVVHTIIVKAVPRSTNVNPIFQEYITKNLLWTQTLHTDFQCWRIWCHPHFKRISLTIIKFALGTQQFYLYFGLTMLQWCS